MKNFTNLSLVLYTFLMTLVLTTIDTVAQQKNGNGNLQAQTRKVSDFRGVNVSGGFSVEIKQGNNEELRIEAEENLLDNIKTVVRNGVLHIYSEGSINTSKGMKAYVTVKELNKVSISGGVKVVGLSTFKTSEFDLDMSGGSNVKLAIDAKTIDVDMSGASKITLTGKANDVTLDMSGASNVDARELAAKNVKVGASGASHVKVNASETLSINASGASHVAYAGTPKIDAETTAASRISKL
ncbi:head GIN domain-containing protein [Pontibacter sp. H259]|uniref:head GIN domain-containing protein n=1 Tax=Pontibacter sp. H259 TaxID=3133421 RepID=UPI0030C0D974